MYFSAYAAPTGGRTATAGYRSGGPAVPAVAKELQVPALGQAAPAPLDGHLLLGDEEVVLAQDVFNLLCPGVPDSQPAQNKW